MQPSLTGSHCYDSNSRYLSRAAEEEGFGPSEGIRSAPSHNINVTVVIPNTSCSIAFSSWRADVVMAAHVQVWLKKADAIVLGLEVVSLPAVHNMPSCWLPPWSQYTGATYSLG